MFSPLEMWPWDLEESLAVISTMAKDLSWVSQKSHMLSQVMTVSQQMGSSLSLWENPTHLGNLSEALPYISEVLFFSTLMSQSIRETAMQQIAFFMGFRDLGPTSSMLASGFLNNSTDILSRQFCRIFTVYHRKSYNHSSFTKKRSHLW